MESSGNLARGVGKLVAEGARSAAAMRALMVEPEGRGCRPDWKRRYSNSVDSVSARSKTSPV
jgi:hypothetical protein